MPELWAVLAVLLPILGSLLATISTVDLAYHLRAGAIVLDQRALPSPDTFTFTAAGLPWFDQQWAAQAAFAAIFRLGGWALLAMVRAALVGLIAWLVFRACRSAGAGTRVAAWLTLAGFAAGLVALGLRPQLLGMVLFAATLAILAGRERRPGLVWAIPLIVVVWANVHGSFFLGLRRRRRMARGDRQRASTCSSAAHRGRHVHVRLAPEPIRRRGMGLRPGCRREPDDPSADQRVAAHVAGVVCRSDVLRLDRWPDRSRRFRHPVDAVSRAPRDSLRRAWPTLLWLIGLAAIGRFAEPGVAWWSIAAPVALAGLLRIAPQVATPSVETQTAPLSARSSEPGRSLGATAIAAVLVLAIVALLPAWRGGSPLYGPTGLLSDAPLELTDAVLAQARPGDRIWNAQRWGSWLELAVPSALVAVDSRIELIPSDPRDDHIALSSGARDWTDILNRREVTMVVASAVEQRGLISLLRGSPDWRSIIDDKDGAVFVRASRS